MTGCPHAHEERQGSLASCDVCGRLRCDACGRVILAERYLVGYTTLHTTRFPAHHCEAA